MKLVDMLRKFFSGAKMPDPYRQRMPDESIWKTTFTTHFEIVDKTLHIFCKAFLFPVEDRFKLRLDDNIRDIYKAIYPSKWTPDTLEDLYLIDGMKETFGVKLEDSELENIKSLKDLVDRAITAQPGVVADRHACISP